MKLAILFGAGFLTISGAATAQEWSCSNNEFEISCGDGACTASESFTPMSVHVSRDEMSVCVYSTCMDGPVTQFASVSDLEIFSSDALGSNNPAHSEEFTAAASISINTAIGAGVINGPFQTPMTCSLVEPMSEVED